MNKEMEVDVLKMIENRKAMHYASFLEFTKGKDPTLLDFQNYVFARLAEIQTVQIGASQMLTMIIQKLGGLQNESDSGDKQANATETPQGSDGTATDNGGIQ